MRFPSLVLVFAVASGFSPATAAVIHVLPDGTGDVPTIADALTIAVFGDSIALGDGTFYEHDLQLKSGVSLVSDSGEPARTVVDAELAGRCLYGPSVTGAPSISGITFQNGVHAEEGGLLLAANNNIRFYDCVFRNGSAPRGGAVSMPEPSAGHAPQFFRCRFEASDALNGGAIWSAGVGYLVDCAFTGNVAQANGGAVFCRKDSGWGIWLERCQFEENQAGGDGGAVYSIGSAFYLGTRITEGYFRGNSAFRGGAAWLNQFDFSAGSRYLDNYAIYAGGALHLTDTLVDEEFDYFSGNLLARNRAGGRGGAIAATGHSCFLRLYSSTLSDNQAPEGAHLWSDIPGTWGDLSRSILAFGIAGAAVGGSGILLASCGDVYGNAGGDFVGPLAGQGSINGNLSDDPLFCDPDAGDYALHEGSPCYTPLPDGCGTGAIGAFGIGCGPQTSVAEPRGDRDVRIESWGRVKVLAR